MSKRAYGTGCVYRRGGKWWIKFRPYPGAKPVYMPAANHRKEAERLLRTELSKADRGEFSGPARATVAELLADLEQFYLRKRRRSLPQLRSRLKPLLAAFETRKATLVGSRLIDEYADARLDLGYEPATVNRELEILRRAYRLAHEDDPPRVARVPKIHMLPVDNVRTGFLDYAQYQTLHDCLRQPVRLMFVIAYHVPCRAGETLKLVWERVDLENRIILPPTDQSANKRVGVWPLYDDLFRAIQEAAIVREREWPNVPWVIHRSGRQVVDYRDAWAEGLRLAGLDGLLFHDLRRSAARNMRRAGIPEIEVMKMAGWKTRTMFDRYQIVDPKDVQQAGRRMEKWVSEQKEAKRSDRAIN